MTSFNFADNYKAAGLTPGPEIISLRQLPFDQLRNDMTASRIVELTRLYFGLKTPTDPEWFRAAFGQNDVSFTLVDNQREASVLACCLLTAVLHDGLVLAGLAPLSAAAGGHRKPMVRPEVLSEFANTLYKMSIRSPAKIESIRSHIEAQGSGSALAMAEAGGADPAKISAALKQLAADSNATTAKLAGQAREDTLDLSRRVIDLQEEVEILWWYVGGWTRVFERPFSDFSPGVAAVLAGLDLAAMTATPPGRAAVPALLHRIITGTRQGKPSNVTAREIVEDLSDADLALLPLNAALANVPDICPVLTAFLKAQEIGRSGWYSAYSKAAQMAETESFGPVELGLQVFREAMLLDLLNATTNG